MIREKLSFKYVVKGWGVRDGESDDGDCDDVMRAG